MSFSSRKRRELVVEYWFRVLLQFELNVKDIVNIIIELSNMCDQFDKTLSAESINIENDGTKIKKGGGALRIENAFGKTVASPGMKCYWKLKMIHF